MLSNYIEISKEALKKTQMIWRLQYESRMWLDTVWQTHTHKPKKWPNRVLLLLCSSKDPPYCNFRIKIAPIGALTMPKMYEWGRGQAHPSLEYLSWFDMIRLYTWLDKVGYTQNPIKSFYSPPFWIHFGVKYD